MIKCRKAAVFLLLMSFDIFTYGMQCPYNNVKTCYGGPKSHTLCKFPYPKHPSTCGNPAFIKARLTEDEKYEILKAHNNLRYFVAKGKEKRGNPGPQPPARNIGPLKWDKELEKIAQRWADQCVFGHDRCRDVERFRVGQNIAYKSFSNEFPKNLTEIVLQWYDEVEDLNNNLVKKLRPTTAFVLHYTQMVWSKTTNLGCGAVRYKKHNIWYTTHLVCNYAPAGNMIGSPIYDSY